MNLLIGNAPITFGVSGTSTAPLNAIQTESHVRAPAGAVRDVVVFVLIFFVVPLALRTALYVLDPSPDTDSYANERADMTSTGLLPLASSHPPARVLLMSVPVAGKRGQFISHSWIVFKRKNARDWSRYDVLGFAARDAAGVRKGQWLGNSPTLNRYAAAFPGRHRAARHV